MSDFRAGTAHFNIQEIGAEDQPSQIFSNFSEDLRKELAEWCAEFLKLKNNESRDFQHIWKDGKNLCRLIEKIFKPASFKYYKSPPITKTQIRLNFKSAFGVLRNSLSFKSDFLYSDQELIKNNEIVLYGLLLDLKNFAKNSQRKVAKIELVPCQEFLTQKVEKFKNRPFRKFEYLGLDKPESKITAGNIKKVKEWLIDIGLAELADMDHGHFYQNPYKNGFILNEILKKMKIFVEFNEHPNTKDQVLANLDKCLSAFNKLPAISCHGSAKDVLYGKEEAVFGYLLNISQVFKNSVKQTLDLYNNYQRQDLKDSLKKWLIGFSIPVVLIEPEFRLDSVLETSKVLFGGPGEKPIEILKRVFKIEELSVSDVDDPDVILLFLENMHRLYDNAPLQLSRDFSYPVYLGRGF